MTVRCPLCGRLNSEEARKCIYCGGEISCETKSQREEKLESIAPTEKPKSSETPHKLFLIISPDLSELSPDAISAFARLMKWDKYSARMRLKSPSPWILKVFERTEEAHKFCIELNNLGIDAYLMKESGLKQVGQKQIALEAEIKDERIIFHLEDGGFRDLTYAEMFLIVRARVRMEGALAQKMGKATVPELSLERQKLFDRIIQRRKEKKISRQEFGDLIPGASTEVEIFDLYSRESHQAIQVIESRFEFSSIFGQDFQARLLGIARFLDLLKSKNPEISVNETFNQVGYTYRDKPAEKKLFFLPAGKNTPAREKLHNSYTLFNEYSAIIYLHYLRKLKQTAEK